MPDLAMLDYFYGDEAEQFTFYRIPKVLFTDPSYRRISSDAKILYGLMLDRMGLSVRNGWLDEYNRVFIFFTLEDALEYLCCGHTKAVSLFGELDRQATDRPARKRTCCLHKLPSLRKGSIFLLLCCRESRDGNVPAFI